MKKDVDDLFNELFGDDIEVTFTFDGDFEESDEDFDEDIKEETARQRMRRKKENLEKAIENLGRKIQ